RKRPRESSPARVSAAGPTTSPARVGFSSGDDVSPPLPPSSLEGFDDDEVVEENVIEDDPEDLEDEGGEDLFGPTLLKDYRENPDKDVYEGGDIDDEEYEAMDVADRMAVEAKLRRRDKETARREGRLPAAFLDDGKFVQRIPAPCNFLGTAMAAPTVRWY
ncbi:MAG: mini-chromosome maintenance protein 2-domain-containing protein, partial [Olpidium bornovanus]